MSSFSVGNHYKNALFFMTYFSWIFEWVVFWNVGRIFILLTGNTLRAFLGLFLLKGFQSSFPVEQFIRFSVYLLMKRLIFDILCKFFLLSWNNATIAEYWIYLTSSLIRFIFYPIRRIYIWFIMLQIYFITFVVQQIITTKGKITTFHWCFQPHLISYKKWLKKFLTR